MERSGYQPIDLDGIFGPDLDPKPDPVARTFDFRRNDVVSRAITVGEQTEAGEFIDPITRLLVRPMTHRGMIVYAVGGRSVLHNDLDHPDQVVARIKGH